MPELKKSLGVVSLLALGVAGVIGSSWIYTNSIFFDEYGAGGMIFGLAIGALLAGCVAIAYAELATDFPRAGGEVVYSYTAGGKGLGFTTGWALIGAYVSSLAFYVTAFGFLLADIFPGLQTIPLYTINDSTIYLPVLLIGVVLAFLVFVLNWFGVNLGAQVQVVLFAAIIIIGIALMIAGFSTGKPSNFWPAFGEGASPITDTLRFVVPAMTYLAGFGLVATLAEDAKISPRRIGRTVVLTVLIAGLFYCAVLLASAWVIPWEDVAKMELGTIDAFRSAGFPLLGWGAYLIAVLGLLTSFIGLFVASSRILVALGRARLLPPGLAKVHPKHGTPSAALIFVLVATLGLGWMGTGAVAWFLDTGGIYLGVVWIAVVLSKYLLPRRYPNLEYEYRSKVGWVPAIGAVGALLVIVFALWPGNESSLAWPAEYVILGVWIVLGIILYVVSKAMPRERALQELLGDYYTTLRHDEQETAHVSAENMHDRVPGNEEEGNRR